MPLLLLWEDFRRESWEDFLDSGPICFNTHSRVLLGVRAKRALCLAAQQQCITTEFDRVPAVGVDQVDQRRKEGLRRYCCILEIPEMPFCWIQNASDSLHSPPSQIASVLC